MQRRGVIVRRRRSPSGPMSQQSNRITLESQPSHPATQSTSPRPTTTPNPHNPPLPNPASLTKNCASCTTPSNKTASANSNNPTPNPRSPWTSNQWTCRNYSKHGRPCPGAVRVFPVRGGSGLAGPTSMRLMSLRRRILILGPCRRGSPFVAIRL